MEAESESNTAPTCFLERSVSLEIVARISDLVGAAFFFAIFSLLIFVCERGQQCPLIQLGAENNTEKSLCLAHSVKNISSVDAQSPYFSGPDAAQRVVGTVISAM
jgi:hypothetical protein